MSNQPTNTDDADREACARAIAEHENTCHFTQADAVLRVLSERGRLRESASMLTAHIADLTRERDEARADLAFIDRTYAREDDARLTPAAQELALRARVLGKYVSQRDAALARAERAERERDFEYADRIVAEAEAARLREALREIADHDYYTMAGLTPAESMQLMARAALAPAAEAPTKRVDTCLRCKCVITESNAAPAMFWCGPCFAAHWHEKNDEACRADAESEGTP